jgi:hypothetical protein
MGLIERFWASLTFSEAVFAAAIAASVGLFLNFRNARESRNRPFLEKQLELCLEACEAASVLATTSSKVTFKRARSRFLELYWGTLSVVEDKPVASAMVDFRRKLNELVKAKAPLPLDAMETDSYRLARAVRNLLIHSWQIRRLERILDKDEWPKGH